MSEHGASTPNPFIISRALYKFVAGASRPVYEYRGHIQPPLEGLDPLQQAGDIYLVLSTPHRVFFYCGSEWTEWTALSATIRHPATSTLFLHPTKKHIIWGDSCSSARTIKIAQSTFGANATVHDYVAHIITTEQALDPEKSLNAQR